MTPEELRVYARHTPLERFEREAFMLLADLGEALDKILSPWDGTQHSSIQKALAPARDARARLDALFPEEEA